MASEERVQLENIFSLPGLEVHLNASRAIPKLREDIKKLEAMSPGPSRREAFTKFFKMLHGALNVQLPEIALSDLPVESGKKTGDKNEIYLYWRNRFGVAFFVAVDLRNDRIGVWDTQKTGKFLLIQQ